VNLKKKLCVGCKKEQYIWKNQSNNLYCKPCWHRIKDKVNLIKIKPVLKKNTKPIKKVSSKMSVQLTIYTRLRIKYLEKYPLCNAALPQCTLQSTDIHHKKGRGVYLNDPTTWLSVCRSCHDWIETHPQEAIKMNYTINKN
jgi:hypothetical protein